MAREPSDRGPGLRTALAGPRPAGERLLRRRRLAWWIWALFFVNLLARGDGSFMVPRTVDPDLLRAIALGQTLILIATGAWLVRQVLSGEGADPPGIGKTGILAMVLTSMALVVILDLAQARRFAHAGYATSYLALALCVSGALGVLLGMWRRWPLLAIMASAVVLKLYPIAVFPITARRSDLLPIIDRALHALWSGQSVYQRFLLDNGALTPNVRFPGLIAAYLPTFVLGVDLRFTLLASEVAFFALAAWRWRRHPLFLPGCALLAFFPYWHLRHELYETPFWAVLLALVLAIDASAPLGLQVVLLAMLLCAHQWGLLLAPFLLMYTGRQHSARRAVALAGLAALLAVPVVWLFSRGDFAGFAWSTFGYYGSVLRDFIAERSFPPGGMSLTPWLAQAGGAAGVRTVNAAAQVVLLALAAAALTSLPRLFAFLAASLLLMTVTNVVAWTYQYLLPGALLWLGLMAAEPDRFPHRLGPGHRAEPPGARVRPRVPRGRADPGWARGPGTWPRRRTKQDGLAGRPPPATLRGSTD
jgi:hypothetical protein